MFESDEDDDDTSHGFFERIMGDDPENDDEDYCVLSATPSSSLDEEESIPLPETKKKHNNQKETKWHQVNYKEPENNIKKRKELAAQLAEEKEQRKLRKIVEDKEDEEEEDQHTLDDEGKTIIVVAGPRQSGKTHTVSCLLGIPDQYPILGDGILRECTYSIRYMHNPCTDPQKFKISLRETTKSEKLRKLHEATSCGWNVSLDTSKFTNPMDKNKSVILDNFRQVLDFLSRKWGFLDPMSWSLVIESREFTPNMVVVETPDIDMMGFMTSYEALYAHHIVIMSNHETLKNQESLIKSIVSKNGKKPFHFVFSMSMQEITSEREKIFFEKLKKWEEIVKTNKFSNNLIFPQRKLLLLFTPEIHKDDTYFRYERAITKFGYYSAAASTPIKEEIVTPKSLKINTKAIPSIVIPQDVNLESYFTKIERGVRNPEHVLHSMEFRVNWMQYSDNSLLLREMALRALTPEKINPQKNMILTEMVFVHSILPARQTNLTQWIRNVTDIILEVARDKREYDHSKNFYSKLSDQRKVYKALEREEIAKLEKEHQKNKKLKMFETIE